MECHESDRNDSCLDVVAAAQILGSDIVGCLALLGIAGFIDQRP